MSQCVQITQNQDGTLVFTPDSQTDLSQCSYVIQTGAEAGNSLTALSPAQGELIGGYVAALWASAWAIKQVAKVLHSGDQQNVE